MSDIEKLKKMYLHAKKAYYAGTPIMSDAEFDRLEDFLLERVPDWNKLHETGYKVVGEKKAKVLPFFMPSLNKCYPEDINAWYEKNPNKESKNRWMYMDKLDGNSVMLCYHNGYPQVLMTRGDGAIGKDCSYFLKFLKTIPAKIKCDDFVCLRCEAILRKDDFESKYQGMFDNARNGVAGILNSKTLHPALSDVHFVVLGVFGKPLCEGLTWADAMGFETVRREESTPGHEPEILCRARTGIYEADGIVICKPDFFYQYENADKPKKDIVAYKENQEILETTVKKIIYQVSAAGRVIPKIEVEPVTLAGACVRLCTAHNAKWMLDHKLGIGSRILITRSGEVIPKIVDVLTPGKIVYPDVPVMLIGVHFYTNEETDEQKIQKILWFITKLGIENVGYSAVSRLYHELYISTVLDLLSGLKSSPERVLSGCRKIFGEVRGKQIFEALSALILKQFSQVDLLTATCVFGSVIASKRLKTLEEHGYDLFDLALHWTPERIRRELACPGFSETSKSILASGLHQFGELWTASLSSLMMPPLEPQKKKALVEGVLSGVNVTFTGYRDKEQEHKIESLGGTVIDFSSKTTVLLYREGGRKSSKIAKAGERAMTWEKFRQKFGF